MDAILITGGNGAMAKKLVMNFNNNYDFVLLDLQDKLDSELVTFKINYFKCDICKIEELKKVEKIISESNIKIVAIINNAAIDFVPNLNSFFNNQYSSEMALKVLNVNVVGAINVIEVFKNLIIKSKGNVINISSIYSKVPADQKIYSDIIDNEGNQFEKPIYYGLSKASLNYVTKYYVNQLSEFDVKVNTIIFGGIEANQPESFKLKYMKKVPLKRMGCWDDVYNVFEFILSKKSTYITGNEILVEGGFLSFN
jgi:NAD(P)-dependent dehydrogenase (short-subunit alcohol dehydrogenase family)